MKAEGLRVPLVADIADSQRIRAILRTEKPTAIFHAADRRCRRTERNQLGIAQRLLHIEPEKVGKIGTPLTGRGAADLARQLGVALDEARCLLEHAEHIVDHQYLAVAFG